MPPRCRSSTSTAERCSGTSFDRARVLRGARRPEAIMTTAVAPELSVSEWLNSDTPLTLVGLRGRPVLLHLLSET